jgi:hypothetical protein
MYHLNFTNRYLNFINYSEIGRKEMAVTIKGNPQNVADMLVPGLKALIDSKIELLIADALKQIRERLTDEIEPYLIKAVHAAMDQSVDTLNVVIKLEPPTAKSDPDN